MTLTAITDLIREDLAAVAACFEQELASDLPCVNTLIRHVSRFRGKMLRPTLLLLCARAVGGTEAKAAGGEVREAGGVTPSHITLATVVEMVHMATLVHDDVLDEAEVRRKGATINHLRGNEAAVMLGDYLISHSYHLCSSLQSQYASRMIAHTTNKVCEGELLQIHHRNNTQLDESTYIEIITRKTAVLIGACCALGARFAGAPADVTAALEHYGTCLGIAFQIQDDILDVIGDPAQVGKTLGIDLEKGKLTLPMIHFLRTAPREHCDLLRSLLASPLDDAAEKIRNLVLPSPSIDFARRRATEYVHQAQHSLALLPPSEAHSALEAIAEFVVTRAA